VQKLFKNYISIHQTLTFSLFEWDGIQMATTNWRLKRYNLLNYNKKTLDSSIKSWVKEKSGGILGNPKFDIKRGIYYTAYSISSPEKSVWREVFVSLSIYYISPILYVWTTDRLPQIFEQIIPEIVEKYVTQNGGKSIDFAAIEFEGDWLRHPHSYLEDMEIKSNFQTLIPNSEIQLNTAVQPEKVIESNDEVVVRLEDEVERVKTNSEEVLVPVGVTIKVKRSRTIEHTVDVNWHSTRGGNIDIGLKQLISASIHSELEQTHGRTYKQSETIEYEVELNGERYNQYKLAWTDIWRKGVVEFQQNNTTQVFPFRFREQTELEVIPINSKNTVT